MNRLAVSYWTLGRLSQSIPLFEELLASQTRKLPSDHPRVLASSLNLGTNYRDAGRLDEAIPLLQTCLQQMQLKFEPAHPSVLSAQENLADALIRKRRYEDAEPLLQSALSIEEQRFGWNNSRLGSLKQQLAECLLVRGDSETAYTLFRESVTILKLHPTLVLELQTARSGLAESLIARDEYQESEKILLDVNRSLQDSTELPHQFQLVHRLTRDRIVKLYRAWGKPELANQWEQHLVKDR